MKEDELNQLLQDYTPLFHKVLKACHVYVVNNDYEDYLQIVREGFFLYAKEFATRAEFDQNYQLGYLFQRLRWQVIDAQRTYQRHQNILDQAKQWYHSNDTITLNELPLYFKELRQLLTPEEQQLLEALFIEGWTMTTTARYLRVSRDTLYKRKHRLRQKLIDMDMKDN